MSKIEYEVVEGWEKLPDGWSFVEVAGVATDSQDRVFVFNRGEHPMIVFDADGNFIKAWGEGVFTNPHGVYIGPADLCQSYGAKERVDLKEPAMVAVLDQILDGCKKRKLIAGIHTMDPNYARQCVEQGYQFVTIQSDARLLAGACQDAIKVARGEGSGADKAGGPY